jgi:hypothetical protein
MTWGEIFSAISPHLVRHPNEKAVNRVLAESAAEKATSSPARLGRAHAVVEQVFMTVRTQLVAQKLVSVNYSKTTAGGYGLFWTLTPKGRALMMKSRTVSTKKVGSGKD